MAWAAPSFEEAYEAHFHCVFRYLSSRTANEQDAQDVAAEVFSRAYQHWSGFRADSSVRTWLFSIARNTLTSHYRRRRHHEPLGPHHTTVASHEAEFLRQEERVELLAVVHCLPDDQQELLALRFAGGLRCREIAEVVGKTEAAVKMALHRTVEKLRKEYEA